MRRRQAVHPVLEVGPRLPEAPSLDAIGDRWRLERHAVDATSEVWPREVRFRRFLNVLVAALGILATLPLMILIAVAIKISSPGPVFFKQVRVGVDRRSPHQTSMNWRRQHDHGGRLFTLYKFRTMDVVGEDAPQVWATPDDPRVFFLGRILRTYRFDELPQLFNVLKGDMNMVGPRPEQPGIFSELREQIGRYPHRQRVLPGITGLAQVNHHYDQSVDDVRTKLTYDLAYIRRLSAAEDLRIMAQTVPAVLLKKGGW
jgi:lipopolysaccharide/colanic/teichoic acid biosynthesis glycosyltransferase